MDPSRRRPPTSLNDGKKRLLDKKRVNEFIDTISRDKNAFELFKHEAQKGGMLEKQPQA